MAHSIVSRATECLDLFNECLTQERLKLDADTERHRAAFILWASTIGAFAHKSASADSRLENHGDIKRTFLGILEELVERLKQLYVSANRTPRRPHISDALHIEMQDTSSASYSISSPITSEDSVSELYEAIEGLLDWLIRFAVAIRRAASHNRDIKSEQYSDPKDKGFEDFRATTRDLLDCLRAKQFLDKTSTNVAEKTKKDLELNKPREDVYQRMIEGNVRRRKRFLYMRSHDEHLRVKPGPEPLIKKISTKAALPVPHLAPSKVQRLPSENDRPNIALTSSVKSSAHTTATSIDPDKFDLPHRLSPRKSAVTLAPSAPAMKVKHHYPGIPKKCTGNGSFKCSYCCLPVELAWGSKLQKNEQEEIWRLHVKSDLRPYVCLLATCTNPTESFISRTVWIRHMELEHQKKHTRWVCRSRHQTKQVFDREVKFVEHMRESHGGSFTEAMLPRLISRSALPAPHIFTSCPVCGYTLEEDNMEHASKETSLVLLRHIGEHLETVALSALPDILFDSSERSIRSRSSVSSSDGSTSTRRDYLSDQREIQSLQDEISMPTEVDETEAEDWAWVYYKLSLDPESPKPFNCPYSENKLFIDRPKMFRQLLDMLDHSSNESGTGPASPVLIHGPQGTGKSQLAAKYAHRVHRGRKDVTVFWFFGSTAVDLKRSSLSPMDNRLLPKEKVDGLEWVTRAHSWLQDKEKGAWLAVIDDACLGIDPSSDEEESFWQLVEEAIPVCSHGTLLITSRKRPRVGFRDYRTLEVGEMTTEESHALVRSIFSPKDVEEREVAALANTEEKTPLALIEAVDRKHPRLPETRIMLSSLWSGMSSRRERTSSVGMSGADAIGILGVISSIITIVNETKKTYDAATDAKGLPQAFREVASRLPIVENFLDSTKKTFEEEKVNNDSLNEAKHIVEACEEKARKLQKLFDKVILANGASDLKRYYKAVKALGEGSEVEKVMKGMLEDLQLLACERGISNTIPIGLYKDEAQDCLRALFLTDPRDDRAQLMYDKGPRFDGTCQWIKSHALYKSWLRSHSQLLWLSGGPGKGKTMLSIFLAEELEENSRSQNKPFLQYFCDNKDERRNTAVAVLRGLIFQLLQLRPKLFDHILPTFGKEKQSLFSLEMLWTIFESMVYDPALETTYCVLDGVNECEEASLEILLGKFAALFSAKTDESSACHLNLLLVSRSLPDFIPNLLSSFPCISLESDASPEVNKNIDVFIEAKVEELSRHRQYPKTLRMYVEKVFRERAQGSFLWVGIVTKALENFKATEVEEALDRFPPGLYELYARMLLQIHSGRREITARILRWVVMAVRPLTLLELSIAIEPTVSPSIVASRNERIRDQISYCGDFLVIKEDEEDEEDNLVRFIHQTVKEYMLRKRRDPNPDLESFRDKVKVGLIHQTAKDYLLRKRRDSNPDLESFRIDEDVANLEIARRCLDYLQSGALENSKPNVLRDEEHLSRFPLLSYAALHWHEHASFLDCSEDIFDLSLPFYHKKSQIRTSWLKAYWVWGKKTESGPPESFTLLHMASCFGILPLVQNLVATEGWRNNMVAKIKRSSLLDKTDSHGMTALMRAAEGGHGAIVQLLLEKGANIELKTMSGETALTIAASSGHEAVMQLLLRQGANPNAENNDRETALE